MAAGAVGAVSDGLDPAALVGLLQDLIRAESPDPPGDETRVAAVLEPTLRRLGLAVETEEFAPGRYNMLARVRGTGRRPGLVFSAHMDTLPAGTGTWMHPPFSGHVADGRIFGRGACDMKSGLAAMVSAAAALQRDAAAGRPPAGDLVLALTGGESSSCLGARRLAETGALAGCDAILVSEPSSLAVLTAEKGALWMRAVARGVAGHLSGGARNSAIDAMVALLPGLPAALPAGTHPLLGSATVNVGRIEGGTAINLTPDRCVAEIDVRYLPGQDPAAIAAAIAARAGPGITIETIDDKPPVDTPEDDPFVALCLEETARATGRPARAGGVSYFSDACILSPAFDLPMAIIGPGALGGSGALDESCAVDDLVAAARLYARIARRRLEAGA